MANQTFIALVVRETDDGRFTREIETRQLSALPDNDVLIRVEYSSLNFKDALSATGVKRVTAEFPHTPGIDAAGSVVESRDAAFAAGDQVLVTGYDLGMNTDGGFGEYIRVPAKWVVKRPSGLTSREAMIYGTAGFTAALSVLKLQQHGVVPGKGPVLVTGASGGVGSLAVAMLAKAGYRVVAVSGKPESHPLLRTLGAEAVIPRQEMDDQTGKMLLKPRWAGVVDTVGGNILATAIKSTDYLGAVTACGWVAGAEVPTNMYPFMIRSVQLLGVDSVQCPMETRLAVWRKLATDWKSGHLEAVCHEVDLAGVSPLVDDILKGGLTGRTLVKVSA